MHFFHLFGFKPATVASLLKLTDLGMEDVEEVEGGEVVNFGGLSQQEIERFFGR